MTNAHTEIITMDIHVYTIKAIIERCMSVNAITSDKKCRAITRQMPKGTGGEK